MDHTLIARSISHSFGKRQILSGAGFDCHTGDVMAIFGRNGTGKSTLLKILFGTLRPRAGQVFVDGKEITDKTKLNRFIAYHHQDLFLPKASLVRNIIPLYFPDGDMQNKLFHEKHLSKIANQKIGVLSTGEQRFLQFLMLMHLDHYFVLLDEPFSNLEPLYKDLVKEKIAAFKHSKGFIITDHYYQDVLEIATRKMVIVDGDLKNVNNEADLASLGYLPDRRKKR